MGTYDALLVLSFGGPEAPEDVMPFLRQVTRGRDVPESRLLEVAEHYRHFGGRSPIGEQNRALVADLSALLKSEGPDLPVYFGNRNWHPFLRDTVGRMAQDGVRRALVFVTSAFSSYSSCRQYRDNLAEARAEVGPGAPELHKLRAFYNHPRFVAAAAERVREALAAWPPEERGAVPIVFTAHSIPAAMAGAADYVEQLEECARLVAERVRSDAGAAGEGRPGAGEGRPGAREGGHALVFQSRSGPPHVPWLGPDVLDHLGAMAAEGRRDVVVMPLGFLSDHMEVMYDLDVEARARAEALGMRMVRAGTVGRHPEVVAMIRDLVLERVEGAPRLSVGSLGPEADECARGCCAAAAAGRVAT